MERYGTSGYIRRMTGPILYCGDTHLRNAAAYLAGLLASGGESFHYVPSDRPLSPEDLSAELRLVILSDYPAARCDADCQARIASLVERGAGLLMIGGWESFHGLGGDWDGTAVGAILPVEVSAADDRLNSDRPLLVRRIGSHAITDGLPWETQPPYVGGLNRFTAKSDARVLLSADRLHTQREAGDWEFEIDTTWPLLVTGQHGRGRTAALATDVAPHWVGGLVDWGPGRVSAQATDAEPIEVGDLYAQFFLQLVRWVSGRTI
jgi:hypothetical protein